jgi:hypothetical protein
MNSNGSRLFYVVCVMATVLLGLAGYIWTSTQAEISSQRLVDAQILHRLEVMELERQKSLRLEVDRLERWLNRLELAMERLKPGIVPSEATP